MLNIIWHRDNNGQLTCAWSARTGADESRRASTAPVRSIIRQIDSLPTGRKAA